MTNPLLKQCKVCGIELPATTDFFNVSKRNKYGLRNECKVCRKAKRKDEYASDPVKRAKAKARARYYYYLDSVGARKSSRQRAERQKRFDPEAYHLACRVKAHRYRARKRGAEGTHTTNDVQRQYKAQKGRCYWCDIQVGDTYHVDHVIPLDRGGSDAPDNLVISCPFCNDSKGAKLPHEWPRGRKLL